MAEVINFNKARKQRLREQARRQAAENRARFGRSPEQKQREQAEAAEAKRRLDQLKRERSPEDDV